ncbi:BTB/POZ and MATH domain-containing protein 2-like [Lolium rigidum]|uniref:BTB/POZ and MATH domain-containing protein 2-like n=1 Tax=Lolium rigidum TaxID=89674 RepID=UPI001F5C688E|nr:BTB/POZ and MATH domain-containing protein 2-like [Lolium rigidum]
MSSYLSRLVDYLSRSFFPTRSPPSASSKTSSDVVVRTGEKLFEVVGHSLIEDTRRISECFHVGGYDWAVCYYPNGVASSIPDGQFASVFLMLMSDCESKVKASFTFSLLQDPAASPATGDGEKNKIHVTLTHSFISKGAKSGLDKFVSKADLAALEYLKDDCLVIKCNLEVIGDRENAIGSIIVPPSSLNTDLLNLLETGHKADLTINIVGSFRRFKVHGCMLAARSPVFRALLCGSMMESKQSRLSIDDTDADVFELLLYYIYHDCLPESMDEATEEATNMAQHLFVAADRYGVERLKLMCQSKLSQSLDVDTVGFVLDLAERCNCCKLKAHCLSYIERNCNRWPAIEETQGFAQLKVNHPLLAQDILAKARRRSKNKRNRKKTGNKLQKK